MVLTAGVAQLLALLVAIVLCEAGIWYCITIQLALLRRLVGVLSLAFDQGWADHGQPKPVCDDHASFQSIQMLWMIDWMNYGCIRGRGGRRDRPATYPINFSLFNFSFVYNLSTAKFIVLHRNCYDILHSEDITRAWHWKIVRRVKFLVDLTFGLKWNTGATSATLTDRRRA